MLEVDLNNAPTDVLVAALAHRREAEVYTERNGLKINRPDFTDYLVAITSQNLSPMTKLIITSGHLPAYIEAVQEKPEEALQIVAARINKKELPNIGLLKVPAGVLERLITFTDPKAQQQQFETFFERGSEIHNVADVFEAAKKVKPNWACGDLVHYVRRYRGLSTVIAEAHKRAAATLAPACSSTQTQRAKVTGPQNHL